MDNSLLNEIVSIINSESDGCFVPDLAIINACTTLGAICCFLDNKDYYEFEESCVQAYEKEYVGDTQIVEKKHLGLIFDFIENYDEHITFDIMAKIKLSVEGENYSLEELSSVFLSIATQYCNNIKLSLVSFKNIYSVIYYKTSLIKQSTFIEACEQCITSGKQLLDKIELTTQKNVLKTTEIKSQLRAAFNNVFSDEAFSIHVPILDQLFVFLNLAAVCAEFAGLISSDFLKISQASYNLISTTPLDKFCSDAQYIDYTFESPNVSFLHKLTAALSQVLKNNYTTNRMTDLTYALLDMAVEISDKAELGKFKFTKYCLTVFSNKPTLQNLQRDGFTKTLDDIVSMYGETFLEKKSIIDIAKPEETLTIDPKLMN